MSINRNVYFFVSSMYSKKNGIGGISTLVDELTKYLLRKEKYINLDVVLNDIEVISLYGDNDPNGCNYKNTILQNFIQHSPEFGLVNKIIFWVASLLLLIFKIFYKYRIYQSSILVSCSPGSSVILCLFFKNVIIWENVAFFSKRRLIDHIRIKFFLAKRARIIVPTITEKASLVKKYSTTKNIDDYIHYMPDWVNIKQNINIIRKEKYVSYPIRFIAAGSLEFRKGFDLLIHAMAKIKLLYPYKLILDIYGEGNLRNYLQKLISDNNLNEYISLRGFDSNLYSQYINYDGFILSSRYEGFPLVLISALASSLPVISTDCPTGPSEIIFDGVNGILTSSNSVDSLANAISRFIDEIEYFRNVGADQARLSATPFLIDNVLPLWRTMFINYSNNINKIFK